MFRVGVLVTLMVAASPAFSQTAFPTKYDGPILTEEVVISGTTTLDNSQLQDIENYLTSRRIGNQGKEIRGRIKDAFQQRGYFDADVTNLKVRPLDPLARPMPVRIEADVTEGPRFKIGAIKFTGNHAISDGELRGTIPLHAGDWFEIDKVRSGLGELREKYSAQGFINFTPVPNTDKTGDGQVTLTIDIDEGKKFRMGTLHVFADKPEQADELQQRWKLQAGEPFDPAYMQKFFEENEQVLPIGFTVPRDYSFIPDCQNGTVDVIFQIDAKRASRPQPKSNCEKAEK